jgi:deoxyribose-phosphate aldolase
LVTGGNKLIKLFKCPEDNDKIAKVMECIEYTALLNMYATHQDIKQACEDAVNYRMARIVPFQIYITEVIELLKGTGVKVVQGNSDIVMGAERLHIVEEGLRLGCCEIDIVSQLSLFLDKKYDEFQKGIHDVFLLTSKYNAPLKLIIETAYLTDKEKILISKLGLEAGAAFIKTCTGMRRGRCTMHDILLLKDAFGDKIKIKASGSVASLEDAYAMMQAGADRVALRGLAVNQMRALRYKTG